MTDLHAARALVADALGRPVETVGADAAVGSAAGWDSLGHMAVVLALEARIGRMLQPGEIGRLKSVGDVAAILTEAC
jgi:acyl carrier protein